MSASAAVDAATERLEAIRLRADAATPGPWNDNGEDGISQTKHITRDVWMIPRTVEDVTFIAHARADVPWLRERLEVAERQLVRYIEAHDGPHGAAARVAVLEQERDERGDFDATWEAIHAVRDRAETAEARIVVLREALSFYADPGLWDGAAERLWADAGTRARDALALDGTPDTAPTGD